MKKEYERHPLSSMCFDMTPAEWVEFDANVARNGVKEPIVIWQNKVLDGWHRYVSAQGNQLPCPEKQFDGTAEEAKELVRIAHSRRNWTPSQRALFEAELGEWMGGGALGSPPLDEARTVAQQAETAHVSDRTMQQARAVVRNAIPRVIEAVKDGALSVKAAAAVAAKPKREQVRALREAQEPKPPRSPWRAATPAPRPHVGPSKDAYDEAMERIQILTEELDNQVARNAVLVVGGATDEERIEYSAFVEELRAQNKTLKAELEAVKVSRNSYMEEANELKRQCAMQRNQLAKFRDSK